MRRASLLVPILVVGALAGAALDGARSEDKTDASQSPAASPFHLVSNWAKLPEGRRWGMAIGVDIDRDGSSVWLFDRCGGKACDGSNIAPIQKFDASGRLVLSFGSGLFSWPHGLFAAPDGTLWVTDGRKQTVMHFTADGRLLQTLGKPGVTGDGPDTFNSPSDVLVAPNGDIFVADGHGDYPVPHTNDRIVKFSGDGKFIKAWGHHGSEPGNFNAPHGLAMDSAGRLLVADRANNRVQIFDQDGKLLKIWTQFGRPSGIYIRDDVLYVSDSQSNDKTNPPFRQGIRIGSVQDGKVTAFIPAFDPKVEMPEGVAADKDGNVFGGFATGMDFKKFAKN